MKLASKTVILLLALGALTSARGQYVADSIDIGSRFFGRFAYNPTADVVYGTGDETRIFVAIDCASNQRVAVIESYSPGSVWFDSVDNKVFFEMCPDSLMVVDGVTHRRVRTIYVADMYLAGGAWSPEYNRLYFSLYDVD
ncbi:MAG: hypothetical protein R6X13_11440, partial [bacterium]